jgi:hypothetical protein
MAYASGNKLKFISENHIRDYYYSIIFVLLVRTLRYEKILVSILTFTDVILYSFIISYGV